MEQKNFFLLYWIHFVPIFLKIIFSTFFSSEVWFLDSKKKIAFIQFFMSHATIQWEIYIKFWRIRKYSLEKKCEWNWSVLWLFLAIVASYMTCLDRMVLAYQFRALVTFLVYFSVLNNVGQTEHLKLSLPPSSFTVVGDAGCLQGISIAVMALWVCLLTFPLPGLFLIQGLTTSSPRKSRCRCLGWVFCYQLGYFINHSTNAFTQATAITLRKSFKGQHLFDHV